MSVVSKLPRTAALELLQDLGHNRVQSWPKEEVVKYLKLAPDRVDEGEWDKPSTSHTRKTFNLLRDALANGGFVVVEDAPEDAQDDEDETVPARQAEEDNDYDLTAKDPDEVTFQEETPTPPKKRGRKPKAEKETAQTKPRGRPKKVVEPGPMPAHASFTFSWKEPPKVVKPTQKLVEEFKNMQKFPGDRDFRETRGEFLRNAFQNDEFHTTEWTSCEDESTGEVYRLNGNTSSTELLRLLADGKVDLHDSKAYVTVKRMSCPTMRDMTGLYATMDPKQSARNKADVLRGYASISDVTRDLLPRQVSILTTGICFAGYEQNYRKILVADQGGVLSKNTDFVQWWKALLGTEVLKNLGKKPEAYKHLMRMSVAAAMYRTWKHCHKKESRVVTDFWLGIRDDVDGLKSSPMRVLYSFLKDAKVGKGECTERELYVNCLKAWNAERDAEATVKFKYKKEDPTPEVQ